jgi:hypothetical protein
VTPERGLTPVAGLGLEAKPTVKAIISYFKRKIRIKLLDEISELKFITKCQQTSQINRLIANTFSQIISSLKI